MASYFTSATAPTLFPHFSIGLFVFSYGALSTRFVKTGLGIDNNVSPRRDLEKYGEANVAKGKITREQLEKLYRQEGAHANAVENLPYFMASVVGRVSTPKSVYANATVSRQLFAQHAGLPNATINKLCLAYTLIRIGYAYSYINITTEKASFVRSLLWWAGNVTCFIGFWKAGRKLNAGL